MAYRVQIHPAAQKQMLSLPKKDQKDIVEAIDQLGNEPRPAGVKKLRDTGLWRVRLGRYRVVFRIDDTEKLVIVVKVAFRREDTYKRL